MKIIFKYIVVSLLIIDLIILPILFAVFYYFFNIINIGNMDKVTLSRSMGFNLMILLVIYLIVFNFSANKVRKILKSINSKSNTNI